MKGKSSIFEASNKIKIKTILFDVSGVLGDVRGTTSWKIKVAMEEAQLDEKYDMGFIDLMEAYSSGGFGNLFEEKGMAEEDTIKFYRAWEALQEYPPGSVKIYHEIHDVFNKLLDAGIVIGILTRLTTENLANVFKMLKNRGFKGQIEIIEGKKGIKIKTGSNIKVFNPQTDAVRFDDDLFVEKVMHKAIKETVPKRVYIGDELDRAPRLKTLDKNLFAIGSARGFFSKEYLQNTYYKIENRYRNLEFEQFNNESEIGEQYSKVFNGCITNLNDLFNIIDVKEG